ncbi:MAG: SPOR domain-containing protein [Desulforegulaceae bacterium]|nr:SPOR domain-containing protein [Desulforegulaceae bacterium]
MAMANIRSKKKTKGNSPSKKNKVKIFPPSRLVEIVFYSFAMFVLGVFTGRGTVSINFDFGEDSGDLTHFEAPAELKPVRLKVDFYRELDSEKEVQVNKAIIQGEEKLPLKTPLYKGEKKQGEVVFELSAEETVPETQKETAKVLPIEEKKVELVLDKAGFTVQIAAMKNKEDAELLADKISKKGFPAYSVSGKSEDNVLWHRVRVGKYEKRQSAENIQIKLLEKLKINGIVLKIN